MRKYVIALMMLGLCSIDGNISPCELEGVNKVVEYINYRENERCL